MATKSEKMQAIMLAIEDKIRIKITEGHSYITLEINQNISNINHLLVQNAVKLESFIKEELNKALDEFSNAKDVQKDKNNNPIKHEVLQNNMNAWTPRELGMDSSMTSTNMKNMSEINDIISSGVNMEMTNGYYGNNCYQPADPYNEMSYPLNPAYFPTNINDTQEDLNMANNPVSSTLHPEDGSYSHDSALLMFGAKLDELENELNSPAEEKPKSFPVQIPDAYKMDADVKPNILPLQQNILPLQQNILPLQLPDNNITNTNQNTNTTNQNRNNRNTGTTPSRPKINTFISAKYPNDARRGEFTCNECDNYVVPLKHLLTRHITSIHKRNKNLECDQCSYAFATQSDLDSHIQRIHNKKDKSEKKSWKM